jgi:GNAT superfamily N-acetyltransferase
MTDMLVKLYALPPRDAAFTTQAEQGIVIRRGLVPEKHFVLEWVERHFSRFWVSECDVAFSRQPASIWLATHHDQLVGFACYDTTARGFFGPTGVAESMRGRGTGTALLLACLHAMYDVGYAYAFIGHVGPVEYYERVVGASIIEDSTPGAYAGLLRRPSS